MFINERIYPLTAKFDRSTLGRLKELDGGAACIEKVRAELIGTHLDLTESTGCIEGTADEAKGDAETLTCEESLIDLGEAEEGRQRRQTDACVHLVGEIVALEAEYDYEDIFGQHQIGIVVEAAFEEPETYGDDLSLSWLGDQTGVSGRHLSHCLSLASFDVDEITRARDAGYGVTYLREIGRIRDAGARSVFLHFLLEGVFAYIRPVRTIQ